MGIVVSVVLAALLLLNLPFYSGGSLSATLKWRMEHGRLTLTRGVPHAQTFFVDLNSEGLKWAPAVSLSSASDWSASLPLWMPLALSVALTALTWRRSTPAPT